MPSGELHLFGEPIVPVASYEVRLCDATGSTCADPVIVATGKWGDVVSPFGGCTQPNFVDVTSLVDKFKEFAAAPDTVQTDLVPQLPDQVTNFADITADVDAFKGVSYPYTVP